MGEGEGKGGGEGRGREEGEERELKGSQLHFFLILKHSTFSSCLNFHLCLSLIFFHVRCMRSFSLKLINKWYFVFDSDLCHG